MRGGYDGIKANANHSVNSTWYKMGFQDGNAGREWTCNERNNGYAYVDYDAGYKAGVAAR